MNPDNCNCKQCQDIRYILAIINHLKRPGAWVNFPKFKARAVNLHPIAKILAEEEFPGITN